MVQAEQVGLPKRGLPLTSPVFMDDVISNHSSKLLSQQRYMLYIYIYGGGGGMKWSDNSFFAAMYRVLHEIYARLMQSL